MMTGREGSRRLRTCKISCSAAPVFEVITPTQVRLTISEGRYHQVKRMFAAVGNHVVELHRERIGGITLDADLAPGEYRPLTEEEIASVV